MQGAACDGTESCWWDRAFSAQRLDLEGKHTELLCDSGKSRTLVKYKRLIFTERAMTQSVLCVIYGVNAIVKYPGKFPCWLQTRLSHHSRVLSDSQVFASTCGAFCVAHYTKANGWSICVHTVHLTVAVFEVTSLQGISDVWRRGRQTNKRSSLARKKGERDECEARWSLGRWRGQHSANVLKGSYFHGNRMQSSITWCPRTLILLRLLTPNLIIGKTIQINYPLGFLFIDKSFGQMISNNHKWIRACQ